MFRRGNDSTPRAQYFMRNKPYGQCRILENVRTYIGSRMLCAKWRQTLSPPSRICTLLEFVFVWWSTFTASTSAQWSVLSTSIYWKTMVVTFLFKLVWKIHVLFLVIQSLLCCCLNWSYLWVRVEDIAEGDHFSVPQLRGHCSVFSAQRKCVVVSVNH